MAKKKSPVGLLPADTVILTDHGIYQETALNGNSPNLRAAVEQIKAEARSKQPSRQLTALEQLQALRQRMRMIISVAVLPDNFQSVPKQWATITADLGAGMKVHVCATERIAGVEQATAVLTTLDILVRDNPGEREARIFLSGITTGRLLEMMHVLPFEPLVVIGKKNKAGRDSSSAVRRQDAKAKAIDWQHRADEIWQRNPAMEKRKVARYIANQYQPADRPKVETIRKAIKQTGTKKLRR